VVDNRELKTNRNYKWWVFGAISVGLFGSVMDQTGLTIAIPRIADHFDATIPVVQWVLLGYILTTSALILPMGRLSDMVGRKRVYLIGLVIFMIGAGLAGSSPVLVAVIFFKLFQGVGAAMIQANSMAIVTSTFPNHERGKAIGLLISVVGIGAMVGPVFGGALVGFAGWRSIFFLVLPIGLISIVISAVVLDGSKPSDQPDSSAIGGFDWLGAGLSALAMTIFLLIMTFGHQIGWFSPLIVGACLAAIGFTMSFIVWELRSRAPMFPLELFRRMRFCLGAAANFLSFMSSTSIFFLMPFYLQKVQGYPPEQVGLMLAATPICFATIGPVAGRLSDKLGTKWFTVGGLLVSVGAFITLSQISETTATSLIVGVLVLAGIGMAVFFSPNASAILSTVERARYGVATAFLNLVRNTATISGLAIATTIVTATMDSLGFEPSLTALSGPGEKAVAAAFTLGMSRAFMVASAFNLTGLFLCLLQKPEQPILSG